MKALPRPVARTPSRLGTRRWPGTSRCRSCCRVNILPTPTPRSLTGTQMKEVQGSDNRFLRRGLKGGTNDEQFPLSKGLRRKITHSASVATCSTVASPDSRGDSFVRAYYAQDKRESGQSQKKNSTTRGASSTLRKIYKDKQASSRQEEVISKIF
ncbi:hypothetical protein Cgig2_006525 [Carnegiea gigantea]|uniref:Uncharacterized protein n=1 Tax=Carnegiea gigantea TaxID=171969 RepID=A0A9Q1GUH1_9CARY|nr:hypothetical protein Cgig2_006525 [Carnegiea gigantea]